MDQKELQKNIALYYSKLPPSVQVKFSSMAWLETLKKISAKYGLNMEQIQILGTETTLALLGILHLGEYESILLSELKIEKNVLDNMVVEINEEIFKDIRPELTKTFHANNQTEQVPVKNVVSKSNYKSTLYEVAKSHKLNVYQMGVLEGFVSGVVLGTLHSEKFEESVRENLKLTSEENKSLVSDINDKIFKVMREELMTKNREPVIEEAKKERENNDILKQAGIEIMPAELGSGKVQTSAGSLTTAKLTDSFKIPAVKTEYTLNNMTKSSDSNNTKEEKAPTPQPTQIPIQVPRPPSVGEKPKVDPYRMPIE